MKSLPDKTYQQITILCEQGDRLSNVGQYEAAINQHYLKALELVPEPKKDWETTIWILSTIADCYFLDRQYTKSHEYCKQVLLLDSKNPLIHLRYGQTALELGKLDLATQELLVAYATAGDTIFYSDNPKYAEFLLGSGVKDLKFPKLVRRSRV